jgi:hypothetical protein
MVLSVFVYIENCVHVQNIVGVLMFFSEERARFFFVSASLSDRGGFAGCWVMAVRGVASHKPSPGKRQRALALDAGTKGFIGFGYKTKTTGFIGCAGFGQIFIYQLFN